MKNLKNSIFAILFLLMGVFAATTARAEDDPPGRVARLQYMSGSVSVQPQGTDEWVEGTLNRSLTNADNIWTDKDSRAELSVGTGVMRLNSTSSLTLTNVSDNTVQVQLHQGTLNLRVRRLYGGEIYEIDTPNLAFTVQKAGEYRFDVDPDGDTSIVTVWKGEGDATGDGPSVRLKSHEQARFHDGNSLAHSTDRAPGMDGFDDWCQVRDQRLDRSVSARYVSPGVIGSEDLDDYGRWQTISPYGPVWVPAVAPGWAPYRYGHWVWVSPWGWTWVDDAPWGFAPFHYGRWVYYNSYWGWAPGPFYGRPIWAPALVTWFGGPGWGVSVGFGFGGGYGWCPLGWGEPFFPWYGGGRRYFRNINIRNTRIVNINHFSNNYFGRGGQRNPPPIHYANFRAPNGVTAVSRDVIVNGRSVGHSAVSVPRNQLTNARALSRVGIEPNRNSALGPHAGRPAAAPSARVMNRPMVSRLTPPARPTARMDNGRGFNQNSTNGRGPGSMGSRSERPSNDTARGSNHAVPRPPNAGGGNPMARGSSRMEQPGTRNDRSMGGRSMNDRNSAQPHNVPRPPDRSMGNADRGPGNMRSRMPDVPSRGNDNSRSAGPRSVPRPSEGGGRQSRPATMRNPGPRSSSEGAPRSMRDSVPRPTGPVRAARDVAPMDRGAMDRGSRSSGPSYSSPRGGNESPRYSRPEYSSPRATYGGGGYSRSESAGPRGGYSGGYGGGYSGRSAAPQSAPRSYGGGGGGGYSSRGSGGGGGRTSGGGHASSPRGRGR
jgi:hypothetical protein